MSAEAFWAQHWAEWERLEEPRKGRALPVGGFILADPFETLLRDLSPAYLGAAWNRLTACLNRHDLAFPDLSWGWLHPGEATIPGHTVDAPSDFTGWTSLTFGRWSDWPLYRAAEDVRLQPIEQELGQGAPVLRITWTWRSKQWRIAIGNYPLALQLLDSIWTDEPSDWDPETLLGQPHQAHEPRMRVAQAIVDGDQQQLDREVERAQQVYSPWGYHVMVRGFTGCVALQRRYDYLTLPMPDMP